MDKPMIGIRQADGSFYDIMDDAHGARKRLVLSANRPDQHGVRIDLYRSADGQIDEDNLLGTISLNDPDNLGLENIEFQLDLDEEGNLNASANLPGQPPQTLSVDLTPFRAVRSDSEILADDTLSAAELDTLDDSFLETSATLDLPEIEDLPDQEDPAPRSDGEILADDLLADVELDTLDEFGLEDDAVEAEAEPEPAAGADDFSLPAMDALEDAEEALTKPEAPASALEDDDFALPEMDDLGSADAEPEAAAPALEDDDFALPEMDDLGAPDAGPGIAAAPAAESFDLGDLDAGFGPPEPAADTGGDWEKIALDDLEPMEFMDTGDEISKPSAPKPKAAATDDFSMDDEAPLDLGDLDSDFSDLPDLDDLDGPSSRRGATPPVSSGADPEQDFIGLEDVDGPAPWEAEPIPAAAPAPARPKKAPKPAKARPSAPEVSSDGLDKTALFLSLAALSLLVLLVLVLLFLNMVKAPTPPVIQPEVMRWKPLAALTQSETTGSQTIDLAAPAAPEFRASSVLEVPAALLASKVSLRLGAGDTVAEATRRFGPPALREKDQLFW